MIYTVNSNDTIYSISERFGIPSFQLISDNGLDPLLPLVKGQSLLILKASETYSVRPGDTVYSIAAATGITVYELWQNNPILMGESNLIPGQTLVIKREQTPLRPILTSGYAYTYIDDSQLRATLPYLTYLSVFPYGVTAEGAVIPPEGPERLVNAAKSYSAVPLLSLTSLTEEGVFSSELVNAILQSEELTDRVIASTRDTVIAEGFGGVDMDFEFIDPSLAEAYAAFVNKLKAALGEGYTVFADLAPKTYSAQPGLLYEGHSYPLLGNAADYLFLMTYEWGYMYGPPLAVSPIANVRSVVEYAVSEITSSKLLLGMPSYGYDWPLPFIKGETKADSLSPENAVLLAERTGSEILYDTEYESPYFYYSKNGTDHVVWFQDARSADRLSRLCDLFGMGGIGIWNVMRAFPQLYTVISSNYSIIKLT